jgi:hypothetical protein
MFDSKSLSEEQVTTIKSWADEGAQLSDIQKKMESEFEQRLTYMDIRFLVLDLGLELKTEAPEPTEESETDEEDAPPPSELAEDDIEVLSGDASAANVKVTVDDIARPGVMASGRVTFSDGQGAMWYVDEMGRLGLDPDTEGYRPSETDVVTFQKELQRVAG